MDKIKNEKGITLVIVLITLLVFSVVGLAVVGSAVNNAKQVKKVESDIQTIDIAEMGVQYYQVKLNDYFHELLSTKKTDYMNLIKSDFEQSKVWNDDTVEQYEEILAQDLINTFKTSDLYIQSTNKVNNTVDTHTKSYYRIDNTGSTLSCLTCDEVEPGERLELTYKSFGYTNQHLEKELTATFVVKIAINKDEIDIIPIPAQNYDYQSLIDKDKPTNTSLCTSSIFENGNNGVYIFTNNCEFNGPITIDRPSGIDADLIFNYGVTFDQVLNKGISGSTIYVSGDFKMNTHINQGIYDSKILIKGTPLGESIFKKINEGIHGSTIVVNGNVKLGDQTGGFKGITHSSIYVLGVADLTDMDYKDYDPYPSSKICVKGTVKGGANAPRDLVFSDSPGFDKSLFEQNCSLGEIVDGDKAIVIEAGFLNWDEKATPKVEYGK